MTKSLFDQAASVPRDPLSGLNIIIVGGGIAGLGFAIEVYRKGHNVSILEHRPDFNDYGDLIAIQASALHSPKKWPGFLEYCDENQVVRFGTIHKPDGTHMGVDSFPLGTSRAFFHDALHQFVKKLGVDITFSTRVINYFETENEAGIILDDESRLVADIVVAADGIGSRSWNLVSGFEETPISSGFAMFRATYPVEYALDKPRIAKEYGNVEDKEKLFVGPGAHIIVARAKSNMIFMLTHKDTGTADEDWKKETSVDHAIPMLKAGIPNSKTSLNPLQTVRPSTLSLCGVILASSDAAHTFLPTSASGATMALEDGYSLAACLQISGKKDAPLAVKVHNHLRAERVACAQRMGFKTREVFHSTDWTAIEKDPTSLLSMVGKWLVNHDPEQYAYDNYDKCASHLTAGTPFKNTNTVPGYTHKPWTVQELLEASARGEKLADEVDWV